MMASRSVSLASASIAASHCCAAVCSSRVHFASFSLKAAFPRLRVSAAERVEIAAGGFGFAQFVERFVELENFFEQFRRRLLLLFAFFARAFEFEQIFDASDGIAQHAIGVVQLRAALQRISCSCSVALTKLSGWSFQLSCEKFLLRAIHSDPAACEAGQRA